MKLKHPEYLTRLPPAMKARVMRNLTEDERQQVEAAAYRQRMRALRERVGVERPGLRSEP